MNAQDFQIFMKSCTTLSSLTPTKTLFQINETQQLILMHKIPNTGPDLIPILHNQKSLTHQHLESIVDYCVVNPDYIAIFTQYSTHTLWEQWETRRKNKNKFSIEQLENIVVSVIGALRYLENEGVGHGCITARDIVVSETGTIKLIDPCLATKSPLQLYHNHAYSPELLSFNHQQNSNNSMTHSLCKQIQNIDFPKNDIFTTALLILNLGLLNFQIEDCMNFEKGTVDFGIIEQYLNEFDCVYGNKSLLNLILAMLYEDPEERLDAEGVLNFIEEQFELSEDEQQQQSSFSSMGTSKNNKTVNSFLLSKGPSQLEDSSMSQQSLLLENQSLISNSQIQTVKRNGNGWENKALIGNKRTPLIKY